jgi:hypothetical protein
MSAMTRETMGHALLEPESILPSQFSPSLGEMPEKRLLLAVLEEAVGTYQRNVMATDRRGRALFADVEAWFASDDSRWPCSFGAICDAIGLNTAYLRSGLGAWMDACRTRSHETAVRPYRFPFRRVNGTRHRTTGRAPGLAKHA